MTLGKFPYIAIKVLHRVFQSYDDILNHCW